MKKIKKIILVLISALIVLGVFAGCKGGSEDSQGTAKPKPELKVTLSNGAGTNWKIAGEGNLDINVTVTNGDTATIKYARVGDTTVEGVTTKTEFEALEKFDVTDQSFNVEKNGTYTVLVDRGDSVRLKTIKVTNFKARPSAPTYTESDLIIADGKAPLISADGSKPVFKMSWTYDYTGAGADVGSFKVVYTQIVNGEAGTQKEIVVNKNMNTVEIPVEIENAEGFALNYKVKVIAVDKTTHFESLSEEVTKGASELLTVPALPTELKRIIPQGYNLDATETKKWIVVDLGDESTVEFSNDNIKFLNIALPDGFKVVENKRTLNSPKQVKLEIEYTGSEVTSESDIFAGKSITARIGSAEKTSPFTQFIVTEAGVLKGMYKPEGVPVGNYLDGLKLSDGTLVKDKLQLPANAKCIVFPDYADTINNDLVFGQQIEGFEYFNETFAVVILPENYTEIGRVVFKGSTNKTFKLPSNLKIGGGVAEQLAFCDFNNTDTVLVPLNSKTLENMNKYMAFLLKSIKKYLTDNGTTVLEYTTE